MICHRVDDRVDMVLGFALAEQKQPKTSDASEQLVDGW